MQEGSALAAIGTDTGGSVRIPAALSGLVGYRASHSLPSIWQGQWSGGVHLSQSFDTIGFFVRDPRDVPPIAEALFHIPRGVAPREPRIGCIATSFASDANHECRDAYEAWKLRLETAGAELVDFDPNGWQDHDSRFTLESRRARRQRFTGGTSISCCRPLTRPSRNGCGGARR